MANDMNQYFNPDFMTPSLAGGSGSLVSGGPSSSSLDIFRQMRNGQNGGQGTRPEGGFEPDVSLLDWLGGDGFGKGIDRFNSVLSLANDIQMFGQQPEYLDELIGGKKAERKLLEQKHGIQQDNIARLAAQRNVPSVSV